MKDLSTATRIGTDANFLNGDLVDTETLLDTIVLQDLIQFFQKLADDASIVPNNNFDNETNGYQLIDALNYFTKNHGTWQNPVYETGYDNYTTNNSKPLQYRITKQNMLQISGNVEEVATPEGLLLFTLPAGYLPPFSYMENVLDRASGSRQGGVEIKIDGTVTLTSALGSFVGAINVLIPLS